MNPFTTLDHSIDVLVAFIFLWVVIISIKYIQKNHLSVTQRIMYAFIIVVSSGHIFQTSMQLWLSDFASFRVWDLINYLTVFSFY